MAFYRRVDAGRPVDVGLRRDFGFGLPELTRRWRDGPVTLAGVSERRWAWATFLVATLAFVAVAAWRIPWHPVPGGTPPPAPAGSVFTAAQISRANAYSDPARVLALELARRSRWPSASLLGFTSLGARLMGRLRGWWWVRVLQGVLGLAVDRPAGHAAVRDRRPPPRRSPTA